MDLSENYRVKKGNSGAVNTHLAKIKNSVGEEMTAQLKPFKPVIKKQLQRKGFDTRFMSFTDMIPLYYNEFVSNKNNEKNIFQPVNVFEFSENPVFKFRSTDNLNGNIFTHENRQHFNKVAAVTDAIIDKFNMSKEKYRYNHLQGCSNFEVANEMPKEEITQAKAAIKIENELKAKLDGNRPITVKNVKTFLIIGLVFLLLYYISK